MVLRQNVVIQMNINYSELFFDESLTRMIMSQVHYHLSFMGFQFNDREHSSLLICCMQHRIKSEDLMQHAKNGNMIT